MWRLTALLASALLVVKLGKAATLTVNFHCAKSHSSSQNHSSAYPVKFLGFDVRHDMMVDYGHQILMDWTEKAACSQSVAMFLDHLGYRSGTHYNTGPGTHLPHVFRGELTRACGHSDGSYYTDPSWFRFKMVRNPFIRLVSSYFHVSMFNLLRLTKQQCDAMSFADFISKFEKVQGSDEVYGFASNHGAFQHQPFELTVLLEHLPPPYHRIIHVENGHEEITEMNAFLARRGNAGRPFNFTNVSFKDPRAGEDRVDVKEFIGRRPYSRIKDRHPRDYSVMYDADLRQRATKLLSWDLHLYNYSWPFKGGGV